MRRLNYLGDYTPSERKFFGESDYYIHGCPVSNDADYMLGWENSKAEHAAQLQLDRPKDYGFPLRFEGVR